MKTRSMTLIAVVVILAVNAWVLWSQRRTRVQHIDRDKLRAEKLLEWEAAPVNSLTETTSMLAGALRDYNRNSCSDVQKSLQVSFDQLSPAQLDDLLITTAELLACYYKSDGAELVTYMQSRNERLSTQSRKAAIDSLISSQVVNPADIDAMTDLEIIDKAWKNEHCTTGWKAIAHDAGCLCLWRCKGCDSKSMQTLGASDTRIFQAQAVSNHLFEPEWTFNEAHKQPEGVLIADIKVLIQHDSNLKNERSPYFIRYWYSEADQLWHPFHFVHVRAGKTTTTSPVSILF